MSTILQQLETSGLLATAKYLGLDMSVAKSGWSVKTSDGYLLTAVVRPPKSLGPIDRLIWWRNEFISLMRHPWAFVAQEGYSHASKFQAHQIGEVGGLSKMTIIEARRPFLLVSPGGLKMFATGNGSSKKDVVRAAVKARWGIATKGDDEADATVLVHMAEAQDTKLVTANYQRDALDNATVILPSPSPQRVRVRSR